MKRPETATTLASLCARASLRELGVGDLHGAHAVDLVGGDRHAEPGAAHEHAEVGVAAGDALADLDGEVGVVDRLVPPSRSPRRPPRARRDTGAP